MLLAALLLRVLRPAPSARGRSRCNGSRARAPRSRPCCSQRRPRLRARIFRATSCSSSCARGCSKRPACRPDCAASPRLRLEVEPAGLVLRLEIDAAAPTAVPLPGSARDWVPEQVIVDGAPAAGLRLRRRRRAVAPDRPRRASGVDRRRAPRARHDRVAAAAQAAPRGSEQPRLDVQGIGKDGVPEDNLRLSRVRDANAAAHPTLERSALPPFASVTRTLRLGISWQIETIVTRLTPVRRDAGARGAAARGRVGDDGRRALRERRRVREPRPRRRAAGWSSALDAGAEPRAARARRHELDGDLDPRREPHLARRDRRHPGDPPGGERRAPARVAALAGRARERARDAARGRRGRRRSRSTAAGSRSRRGCAPPTLRSSCGCAARSAGNT